MLEERGIGRPSTYASIINTIQDRDYVKKIQGKFVPTEIGTVVTGLLVKNFPYIFDTQYTAKLESELDAVEEGQERWTDLLNGFYGHFEKELVVAGEKMEDIKRMEQATNEICDKCGSPLYSEVGQVRQLLLLLQLLQGEADYRSRRAVEEGPESSDEEDHEGAALSHDGARDRGRHQRLLQGGRGREGDGRRHR